VIQIPSSLLLVDLEVEVSSSGRLWIWYFPGVPTTKNRVSMEHRLNSSPPRHSESVGSCRKNGGGPWALVTDDCDCTVAVDAAKSNADNAVWVFMAKW